MTISERRHQDLEDTVARTCEREGLVLYCCRGLYTLQDGDGRVILEDVPLSDVADWLVEAIHARQ